MPKGAPKQPLLFSIAFKEKIFLAKHLAVMIKAGIPLREALAALLEQAHTPSLRYLLSTCIIELEGGQVLGHCLEKFPRVFNPFFTNAVSVGESSGTLSSSLSYLSAQLEKANELNGKVRAALIYPIIVFVGAIGIGGYLSFFLLPQLTPLFTSLGSELPPTTRLLLAFTTFVRQHWPLLSAALVVLIAAFIFLWQLKPVRRSIHHFFVFVPIFGGLVKQIQTTQFSRILGTLLTAGIKIVPALRITAGSLGNLVYQKELTAVAAAVERGEQIADELKVRKGLFTETTISMVRVGESTGHLSDSLITLAEFTETELDQQIRNLSSLIEPVVLVAVGLLVGFVALSIITPVYQLTQSLTR